MSDKAAHVLITGMSGTGKSALVRELSALGYCAVDLDTNEWSEWVACDGDPTGCNPGRDWVWRETEVRRLLSEHSHTALFVSGCSPNMGGLVHLFDQVILLSAPSTLILSRLLTRTENQYGKQPEEIAAVLRNIAKVEPLLRAIATNEVDAAAPIHCVVAEVLRLSGIHSSSGLS